MDIMCYSIASLLYNLSHSVGLPVFSSLSIRTNFFSASRSFTSSVIATPSLNFKVVSVIGSMDLPEDLDGYIAVSRGGVKEAFVKQGMRAKR